MNAPAGVFDQKSGRATVPIVAASGARYRGRVVVLRHGDIELPVEVELTDRDGKRTRVTWDGHGTHRIVDWQGDAPLAFATIDPEHRILLDDDLMNNAAALELEPGNRTFERALYVAELSLAGFAP